MRAEHAEHVVEEERFALRVVPDVVHDVGDRELLVRVERSATLRQRQRRPRAEVCRVPAATRQSTVRERLTMFLNQSACNHNETTSRACKNDKVSETIFVDNQSSYALTHVLVRRGRQRRSLVSGTCATLQLRVKHCSRRRLLRKRWVRPYLL